MLFVPKRSGCRYQASSRRETFAQASSARAAGPRPTQAVVPDGWAQKTANGDGQQIDRLRNLGEAQQYNINVDHGVLRTADAPGSRLLHLAVVRTSASPIYQAQRPPENSSTTPCVCGVPRDRVPVLTRAPSSHRTCSASCTKGKGISG